jgi:hypothetical protein
VADFDKHLALARWLHIDFNNLQRLASLEGYSGARFHGVLSKKLKNV